VAASFSSWPRRDPRTWKALGWTRAQPVRCGVSSTGRGGRRSGSDGVDRGLGSRIRGPARSAKRARTRLTLQSSARFPPADASRVATLRARPDVGREIHRVLRAPDSGGWRFRATSCGGRSAVGGGA
jgi:hypothetical protein